MGGRNRVGYWGDNNWEDNSIKEVRAATVAKLSAVGINSIKESKELGEKDGDVKNAADRIKTKTGKKLTTALLSRLC